MVEINLDFDEGVPQYECNLCGKCSSLFAKSLCNVKNRGCCWYFPKFTLYEIHKMVKEEEGEEVLKRILKLPNVKVYNYYIHARGYFDKKDYDIAMAKDKLEEYKVHDKTIFFRECPLVQEGKGCKIPARYRSYICNLFICDEVTKALKDNIEMKKYLDERQNYVRWIEWENNSIQMYLEEKALDLQKNFDEVINILKEMPLERYEFPALKEIESQ
ncbi:MAG: hypothetical protein PUE01_03895 [Clostridiaceae bacterium]|nr:hypothetical protein [Clostridiaceae bacterium]